MNSKENIRKKRKEGKVKEKDVENYDYQQNEPFHAIEYNRQLKQKEQLLFCNAQKLVIFTLHKKYSNIIYYKKKKLIESDQIQRKQNTSVMFVHHFFFVTNLFDVKVAVHPEDGIFHLRRHGNKRFSTNSFKEHGPQRPGFL